MCGKNKNKNKKLQWDTFTKKLSHAPAHNEIFSTFTFHTISTLKEDHATCPLANLQEWVCYTFFIFPTNVTCLNSYLIDELYF